MAKPKVIYDPTCPICKIFIKNLRSVVPESQMEFVPAGEHLDSVHYVNRDGVTLNGTEAIEAMVADFPQVNRLMWAVPKEFRTTAIKAIYSAASVARTVIKKGCNCGRKK